MEKHKTVSIKRKFIKCKIDIEKNVFSVVINELRDFNYRLL